VSRLPADLAFIANGGHEYENVGALAAAGLQKVDRSGAALG
jgi:hypothetical protein